VLHRIVLIPSRLKENLHCRWRTIFLRCVSIEELEHPVIGILRSKWVMESVQIHGNDKIRLRSGSKSAILPYQHHNKSDDRIIVLEGESGNKKFWGDDIFLTLKL
jgi:hypothetical protein